MGYQDVAFLPSDNSFSTIFPKIVVGVEVHSDRQRSTNSG